MEPLTKIRNHWRLYPNKPYYDFCARTARNVIEILFENATPGEKVNFLSVKFNNIFYGRQTLNVIRMALDNGISISGFCVDLNDAMNNDIPKLLKDHENGKINEIGVNYANKLPRSILTIGGKRVRYVVQNEPYAAISYIDNEDIARFLNEKLAFIESNLIIEIPA